jgi:lipopolysaccharide transport system ATP-binding protein
MSPPTVISVENLCKVYRLGQIGGRTLSEDLNRWRTLFRGRPDPNLEIRREGHRDPDGERVPAPRDTSLDLARDGRVDAYTVSRSSARLQRFWSVSSLSRPTLWWSSWSSFSASCG